MESSKIHTPTTIVIISFFIKTNQQSLQHVSWGSLDHKGMYNQCVVDVAKERNFLISAEV